MVFHLEVQFQLKDVKTRIIMIYHHRFQGPCIPIWINSPWLHSFVSPCFTVGSHPHIPGSHVRSCVARRRGVCWVLSPWVRCAPSAPRCSVLCCCGRGSLPRWAAGLRPVARRTQRACCKNWSNMGISWWRF